MEKRAALLLVMAAVVCFGGPAAAVDLQISPLEDFQSSGDTGGPFTPPSKDYQLTNIGPNSLYWGAGKTANWLDLDPEWGLLESTESTTLTVSLTPEADLLGEGVYVDTVTFTDLTNGGEQTRAVTLTVGAPGGALYITPFENFEPSGEPGGPFTPPSKDYQLTNTGATALYWGADKTVDWLDLAPTWAKLEPAESNIVTVSLNAAAELLGEGVYTDTLTFTDITHDEEQTRGVTLTVEVPTGIWVDPRSFDVNVIEGCLLPETLTIGNSGSQELDFKIRTHVVASSGPAAAGIDDAVCTGMRAVSSVPQAWDFTTLQDVPHKPGELIVRFATAANGAEMSIAKKNQILGSLGGATIKQEYKIVPGLAVVTLPAGVTVTDALATFNNTAGILYAEPNYELKALATIPSDTRFNELWGMHNTGQEGGKVDADIDAPEAWDIGTGTGEIIVAVIDTGVDYTHIDLAANMWVNEPEYNGSPGVDDDGNGYVDDIYGYDFCNYDGDPMDDSSPVYHGTHCSGTIGAVGNNAEGVAGVCWNVRIMALKFLDSGGSGWTDDAIKCVEYSTLMGANLSSNSWGGGGYSQGLKDAINAAGAAGMLFAAAAGNDSSNTDAHPHYPSSYDCESVISVMSTDRHDNKSGFSNYGPITVDLGAPGSEILSCKAGNAYQYLNGTSMATPHVAGACALVWSMNPMLTNTEVKDILIRTVDPTLSGMCVSQGRLNLYNAILETRAPWIEIDPEEGTLAPGDTNQISVTFDAVALTPGTYRAEIVVVSNDAANPARIVPVTMTVSLDDLQVAPVEGFDSTGTKRGPFEPECMTYTLTNIGTEPVGWITFEVDDWLSVEPNEGVLDPSGSIDVNVCISPVADLLDPNLYAELLVFENLLSGSIKPRPVTLTVKPPDCFTEYFESENDLEFLSLTFSPDGSAAYYEACRERVREFPIDPNGGTYLPLWDDDFIEVVLSDGAEVLFHGWWYDKFYVGSNGYITFGQGDAEYTGTLQNHFSMPRISALFADLCPPDDECISYQQLEDRIVVTFEEVPLFGDKASKNSFQIEIFLADGTIRITWLQLGVVPSVAGLSDGKGIPPVFFVQSDLSRYVPCWPRGDFNRNYVVDMNDLAIFVSHFLDADCNIPCWCEKTDLDFSSNVQMADYAIFADNWMVEYDWWLHPVAHWKFDEGQGHIAYDSAGNNDGVLVGDPAWVTGQIHGALSFDGTGDYVDVDDAACLRFSQYDGFSMSFWAKPLPHPQGFVLCKMRASEQWDVFGYEILWNSSRSAFCFIAEASRIGDTEIYTVDGSAPAGSWYYVTAVYDNKDMKIYLNAKLHESAAFRFDTGDTKPDKNLAIGARSYDSTIQQYFNGTIDDVRIYDRPLSAGEIQEIYLEGLGGRAIAPSPPDEAIQVDPNTVLSWHPGKDALSHDVYFGTDYNDVCDANTTDPNVYMGNQDANHWDPLGLQLATTYYWRIDEKNADETIRGYVWTFTTFDPRAMVSWWKFDEGEGDVAYDSAGDNDGMLVKGPVWTAGQIGGALSFDGVDDYVDVPDDPSLRFGQHDSFSIFFWAKPFPDDGGQLACKMRASAQWGVFGYQTAWTGSASAFYFVVESSRRGKTTIGTSGGSAPAGSWYQVTCVYDKRAMKIYLNGELRGSGTFGYDTGSTTPDKNLSIGARSYDSTIQQYFNGTIDDVRIYDVALSAGEVRQFYLHGFE